MLHVDAITDILLLRTTAVGILFPFSSLAFTYFCSREEHRKWFEITIVFVALVVND